MIQNTKRSSSFESSFNLILKSIRSNDNIESVESILSQYEAPVHESTPRSYHNIDHVFDCLDLLDKLSAELSPKEYSTLFMAIVYHDAIYLVNPADRNLQTNEVLSAEFAKAELTNLEVPEDFIEEVFDLILATDHSKEISHPSKSEKIIRDIDLAGLANDWEDFDKASVGVRSEFSYVDDESYRTGRLAFMNKLIERDYIYMTPSFRNQFESKARLNLNKHVFQLQTKD